MAVPWKGHLDKCRYSNGILAGQGIASIPKPGMILALKLWRDNNFILFHILSLNNLSFFCVNFFPFLINLRQISLKLTKRRQKNSNNG